MIFDFIDGATGREIGAARNLAAFDRVLLQPRVMADIVKRSTETAFLGQTFSLPIGIAPMGMCNLTCPGADRYLADVAKNLTIPVCLSSAASSSMEDMRGWAGDKVWFQLYFGQSADASLAAVERARNAGYDTLVLTADVPQVSRRLRDLRNDFNVPFRMTPRAFLDFALHPRWSLSTLLAGIPRPQNFEVRDGTPRFNRSASRAGADWDFLRLLRNHWPGNLIVKGVTSPLDARKMQDIGVDAIYVSNHGARQLDSAPPALHLLKCLRDAIGPGYPLIFDSGVRNGEDVVKALALGADMVMLGRPVLYALAADGYRGAHSYLRSVGEDLSIAMAQLGTKQINEITQDVLFEIDLTFDVEHETVSAGQRQAAGGF